jgi:HAD superfamily hydrolase (TIGR01509 family)
VAQAHLGRTFQPAEIIALFGPPEEGAMEKVFGRDLLPLVMRDLLSYYREEHDRLACLHPGVGDVLAILQEHGVNLAVFTGKGRSTAEITLERFGIRGFFDMVVTGNDVIHHKPDPEGINQILMNYGLAPSEALMVGDSMADLRASRGAGVHMAAVLWDSYDRDRVLASAPDYVFHQVQDFTAWCRSMVNGNGTRKDPE